MKSKSEYHGNPAEEGIQAARMDAAAERSKKNKTKRKSKSVKSQLIPNNYKGKTAEQVWNGWTPDQRKHFIGDHWDQLSKYDKSLHSETAYRKYSKQEDFLKEVLSNHVERGQYKDGGKMKDQYKGKTAEYVWNSWNPKQRVHFIADHEVLKDFMKADNDVSNKKWDKLPDDLNGVHIKGVIQNHVDAGQYKDGGNFFSKAKELAKSGAAHAKSAYEKAAPHVKKAYEKGKDVSKKAYETTKRTVKQKIHDEKKKIALDVIDETKHKVVDDKEAYKNVKRAEQIVESEFKDGGKVKPVSYTEDSDGVYSVKFSDGENVIVDFSSPDFTDQRSKKYIFQQAISNYETPSGGSMATGDKIENGTTVEHDGENYYVINSIKNYDNGYTYKIRNYDSGSTLTVSSDEIKVKKSSGGSMETGGKTEKVKKCPSGTKIQTLILSKDRFKSEKDAKGWAHSQGFKFGDVEKKENTYRLKQEDESKFKDKSFRTIKLTKGVQSVIGCPVGGHTVKSKLKDGGKPKKKEKYENGAYPSQLGRKPGSIEDLGVSTYIKFLERCMEYFENDPLRDDIEKEINLVLETEDGHKRAVKYYQDKTWHKADIFRKAGAEDLAKAFIAASNKAQDSLIPLGDESTDEPNDEEKAEMWYDTVDEEELNAILIELGYEPSDVRMDGGYPTWDKLSVETRSDLKRHAKKNNLMQNGGNTNDELLGMIIKYHGDTKRDDTHKTNADFFRSIGSGNKALPLLLGSIAKQNRLDMLNPEFVKYIKENHMDVVNEYIKKLRDSKNPHASKVAGDIETFFNK